jgi:glycosyltransferase involved in cell wall biosynthesis
VRLLAHVENYPPAVPSGAERALHDWLAVMVERGHSATVVVSGPGKDAQIDGVTVLNAPSFREVERLYRGTQVVITQLNESTRSLGLARLYRKPAVFYAHAGTQIARFRVQQSNCAAVLWNAAASRVSLWRGAAAVLWPVIRAERYAVTPGDAVTLVNLSAEKGAAVFWEMAERFPATPFVGVRGGYGRQIIPARLPANVTVLPPQADPCDIYRRSRIVLMPSDAETFGRVALEAAVSGIPAVVAPTAGLQEAMEYGATYVQADDVAGYAAALTKLASPREYQRARRAAQRRFRAYLAESEGQVLSVDGLLGDLVGRGHQ